MIKEAKTTTSKNISPVIERQLVTPVSAATTRVYATLSPLFVYNRISDIDVQFGGNGEKAFEQFQTTVSELASTLLNSLTNAVEICEYNGKENEEFSSLEYAILNVTSPLYYKRVKKLYVEYNIFGAFAEPYKSSDVYSTDEMIYNAKFHKKKLNTFLVNVLGDCYKILSEIGYDKENPYSSYAKLKPDELYDAKSAFVDVVKGSNNSVCYRVVADKYLGYFFKIELQVPLYFSDEQSTRYSRIDIDESFLRRYYRKIMKERFNNFKLRKNKMFEVRGNNIGNVNEEEALITTFISSAKKIVNSIENGDLKLSSVDKDLKALADTMAQLNVLIDVAKEFYGNYSGIGDPEGQDKYLDLYQNAMIKMMRKNFKQSGLPHMSGDLSIKSELPYVKINISGDFDEPLDAITIKSIVKTGGAPSEFRLNVDVGRGNAPRSDVKLENGKAVFTAISNTFASDDKNQKDMKQFNIPGKKQGVAKLYIGKDGFDIVAKSGAERS